MCQCMTQKLPRRLEEAFCSSRRNECRNRSERTAKPSSRRRVPRFFSSAHEPRSSPRTGSSSPRVVARPVPVPRRPRGALDGTGEPPLPRVWVGLFAWGRRSSARASERRSRVGRETPRVCRADGEEGRRLRVARHCRSRGVRQSSLLLPRPPRRRAGRWRARLGRVAQRRYVRSDVGDVLEVDTGGECVRECVPSPPAVGRTRARE